MADELKLTDFEFIAEKVKGRIVFKVRHPVYNDRNFTADSDHLDEVLAALNQAVGYLSRLGVPQSELDSAKISQVNRIDQGYLHGFMDYYHSASFGLDEVPETSGVFTRVAPEDKGLPFDETVPYDDYANADDSFSADAPAPVSVDEIVEPVDTGQIVFERPVESGVSGYPARENKNPGEPVDKERQRREIFDAVLNDPEKRKNFYRLIYYSLRRNTKGQDDRSLIVATDKIIKAAGIYKPYPRRLIRTVDSYLSKRKPIQNNFDDVVGTLCEKLRKYRKK